MRKVRGPIHHRGPGGRHAKSLLAGVAQCGVCGGPVKWFKRRTPRSGPVYGCREKGHVYVGAAWLEDHVSREVLAAIDKGRLAKRLRTNSRKAPAAQSDIEERLERLEIDYYERGIIGQDSYLRRREGLLRRLAAAQAEPPSDEGLPRELALHLGERWTDDYGRGGQ
jgi:hypothetical protein